MNETRRGAEQRLGTGSRPERPGPSTGDSPIPDFVMGTRAASDQRQSSANAAHSFELGHYWQLYRLQRQTATVMWRHRVTFR
jgi:hypothetical protein